MMREDIPCYWDRHKKELIGNTRSKVKKMLRDRLIHQNQDGTYTVAPIPGNHQTHIVDLDQKTCSCQANSRDGMVCSHIHACAIYQEDKDMGRRE